MRNEQRSMFITGISSGLEEGFKVALRFDQQKPDMLISFCKSWLGVVSPKGGQEVSGFL